MRISLRHRPSNRVRVAVVGMLVGILSLGAAPAIAATDTPSPTATAVGAGSISGTVTDSSGAGLAGAIVSVIDADGGVTADATTGSQGGYTVPELPAGAYVVSVAADGADPVFWPDATTLGDAQTVEVADATAATGIDIVAGAAAAPAPGTTEAASTPTQAAPSPTEAAPEVSVARVASDPAATAVVPRYTVNVRVAGDGGAVGNAYVTLASDSAYFSGITDASGAVTLTNVPTGSYDLDVYPSDVNYAAYWQRLEVTGDSTTDVVLQQPGTVSGHVTSTDAGEIAVRLLRAEDLQWEKDVRAVDGVFTIGQVRPGNYLLEGDPNGGSDSPTFYPGVGDPHDATVITVDASGSVTGIDFSLLTGHTIMGAVSGMPTSYAQVSATSAPIQWNGQLVTLWSRNGYASVDRDGRYTVGGLADGDYTVSAWGYGINDDLSWSDVYYEGYYKESPTANGATLVSVRGSGIDGIDVRLFGQGTASGEVGAEGGEVPLKNTLITAYRWNGTTWDETLSVSGWGRYSLGMHMSDASYGLAQGTYTVGFSDPDAAFGDDGVDYPYCTQYWNGKDTLGLADRFEVAAGRDTPGINATLRLKSSGCAQDVIVPGAPTIAGTPQVGGSVTADPGSWAPQPIQLGYQWRANGVDIDGATSQTFTPTTAQAGTKLTVAVTGSRPGYESVTVVSPESAVVGAGAPGAVLPGQLTLSGPAVSGVPLVVNPGDWAPQPVDLAYQWSLDDEPIDGATGAGYTPTPADIGGHLTVSVTGTKPGYTPATAVADAGTVSASIALDSSSALPGGAIVVTGSGYDPGETVRVELHSTVIQLGTAVADADGNFRLPTTLPLTAVPGEHHVFGIGERSGREASAPITIGSPTSTSGGTPSTGTGTTSVGSGTASTPSRPAHALAVTGTTVPIALTVLGMLLTVGGAVLLRRPVRRRA